MRNTILICLISLLTGCNFDPSAALGQQDFSSGNSTNICNQRKLLYAGNAVESCTAMTSWENFLADVSVKENILQLTFFRFPDGQEPEIYEVKFEYHRAANTYIKSTYCRYRGTLGTDRIRWECYLRQDGTIPDVEFSVSEVVLTTRWGCANKVIFKSGFVDHSCSDSSQNLPVYAGDVLIPPIRPLN